MATFDETSLATATVTRPALAMRVVEAVSNFFRAWENRRAFYRLSDLSDIELADIGLTRADLHGAIRSPFDFDRTSTLDERARARAERGCATGRSDH